MRNYNLLRSTTRSLVRFRSTKVIHDNGSLNSKTSESRSALNSSASPTAPYTPISRSLVSDAIGVLAGPEAGGVPPFAAVYPVTRHRRSPSSRLIRYSSKPPFPEKETEISYSSSPQDLWTRAFTLAAKDVKNVTSKMLVYFIERSMASYRPWVPPDNTAGGDPDSPPAPVLHHPIRLTLSHYTTLVHGLLLRRHYSVALGWIKRLIYPFPSSPSTSLSCIQLSRTSKHPPDAVHLSLDGPALSTSLVVLARLGRVHEAIKVLEAYAAPSSITQKTRLTRHVRMNAIQMNDFLLVLLRWPSKKHALPVPSPQFPLRPLKKAPRSTSSGKKASTNASVADMSPILSISTRPTRSARPDLLLRLLPALYPRYGVVWDSRTVCLMIQAVRMSVKMDGISTFGLSKILRGMFIGGGLFHGSETPFSTSTPSIAQLGTENTERATRQRWLLDRILEVLWKPVEPEDSSSSPPTKAKSIASKKTKGKKNSPQPHHHHHPAVHQLDYTPFTHWPWPSISVRPGSNPEFSDANSLSLTSATERKTTAIGSTIHPFLLAREIFLRLLWAYAEYSNVKAKDTTDSVYINLHTLPAPATLPPQSFARLMDPDGDGLSHLGGLPKWFGALEEKLKRRFGFGVGGVPGFASASGLETNAQSRADAVDEMFGYPKYSSPALPRLTPTAFHQYILLLGLSAPEPWDFIQAGWSQHHPFEGYPPPTSSGSSSSESVISTSATSSYSSGSFASSTSIISNHRSPAFPNLSVLIPGPAEIPFTLACMRALRLVPTRDTICAAVVFWREAVGGETLFELGLRDYRDKQMGVTTEAGDAYVHEYEAWKASVERTEGNEHASGHSGGGTAGEYAKFCGWIREWVDEVNLSAEKSNGAKGDDVEGAKTVMTMPHPYHIHRWTGIVRKMREGQGYEEGERDTNDDTEGDETGRSM